MAEISDFSCSDSRTDGLSEKEFRREVRSRFSDLEIDFILEIVSRVPVAIWAASGKENDYAVQLWSPGAERLYGLIKKDVIGANYIDTFVNRLERAQAIADHDKLEKDRQPYRNLARDHRADKTVRLMLTQGIALWHPVLGRYLQGEVTFDATEVPGKDRAWLEQVLTPEAVRSLLDKFTEMNEAAFKSLEEVAKVANSLTKVFLGESAECLIFIEEPAGELSPVGDHGVAEFCEFDPKAVVSWSMKVDDATHIVDYNYSHPPQTSQRSRASRFPAPNKKVTQKSPFAWRTIKDEAGRTRGGVFIYLAPSDVISKHISAFIAAINGAVKLALAMAQRISEIEQEQRLAGRERENRAIARLAEQYGHAVSKKSDLLKIHAELLDKCDSITVPKIAEALRAMAKSIEDTGRSLHSTPRPELFNLGEVLSSVTGEIQQAHPNVRMERDDFPNVYMRGVRVFIEGAFESLLLNSLEAQKYAGHIKVFHQIRRDVAQRGRSIDVYFCDKGPGLQKGILTALFERRRISNKGKERGLGLVIARKSFEECKGVLETLDNHHVPGWSGACFRVTLPIESQSKAKQ